MWDSSSLADDLLHSYFCLAVINQSCHKKKKKTHQYILDKDLGWGN